MTAMLLFIFLFRNNVAVLVFSVVLFGIMLFTTNNQRTKWNVVTLVILSIVMIIWNIYLWI